MRWGVSSRRSAAPEPATRAIQDFWSWWDKARPGIEAATAAEDLARCESELTAAVHRIHAGLQWEIGGRDGARQLVVTAAGKPDPRSAAARWLLAAPADRSGWTFHATRQPDLAALSRSSLTVGATGAGAGAGARAPKLALADLFLAIVDTDESWRIQVDVYHDGFSALAAEQRLNVAYLALDWALGEEDVQRWIGEVTAVAQRPDGAFRIADLPAAVADFAERHPRSFALVQATVGTLPLTAIVQMPLSPADFPLFDQHIAVAVPYTSMNSGLLQTGLSAERLSGFDDALNALLADDAVLAVSASHNGQRVFHYYADPSSGAAERVAAWDHGWPEGRVEVRISHDPAWSAVGSFQP